MQRIIWISYVAKKKCNIEMFAISNKFQAVTIRM